MNETLLAAKIISGLGWLDFLVLSGAIGIVFIISYLSGRKEKDTHDFFLGGRKVPAVIACLSFVAAEVSAITLIGVPATGFKENWQYLQFFIGSAASRIFIAFLFIPVFYKFQCTTIYEFLRHRFGPETQYTGSIFFFITRMLAASVRLYAACLSISVIMNWSLVQALIVFVLVSIMFIAFGGIKAVVWIGAFEATIYYVVGLTVCGFLIYHIRGGLAEVWQIAGDAGRLNVFNTKLTLADPTTLWVAILNAFFVGMSVFGTDQELMQRMLTVKTRRSSQNAMLATIAAGLPILCLYLGIGALLFVFYRQNPQLPLPENSDKILSHFVINSLPMGLKGLVLCAIVLASINMPLSSLSSSFVTDIYRRLINKKASEKHYLWVSRLGVIGFGLVLAVMAYACKSFEGVLWLAFKIIAVTGGSTLGIFCLGILTKRVANRGNVVAMVASALAMAVLLVLSENKTINLAWSWLIVFGTLSTFALGWLFSTSPQATQEESIPGV
jgi:solute:Na+ symporter, SSS family